jgi:predicted kinase
MNLIIVSGAEATGKSAIGKYIARELGYTYYAKDVIKEHLFDTESTSTWKYGWYERLAKSEFFSGLAAFIDQDQNLVLESNFIGNDKKYLQKLLHGKTVNIFEVHCFTQGFTSLKRFVRRNETKIRHPGHHDRRWYISVFWNTLMSNLKIHDSHAPVRLSSQVMYVNTTDFEGINMDTIVEFVSVSRVDNHPMLHKVSRYHGQVQ